MSGPFGSSQWMYNSGADFYNGVATQSARFDDGSSAYLSRTPSSAGDRRTYTLSFWVKRANIGIADCALFGVQTDASNRVYIRWEADDTFKVYFAIGGSAYDNGTSMVFRDTSAWYHIVIAVDMDGSVNTDKLKIYVNGTNQTVSYGATLPTSDTAMNSTSLHTLGKKDGASNFLDGYLSEVNFIDGTALDPTSFGETKNGVWIAKEYTGSYGTNGFRLQFNQTGTGTASSSTIGADTSGNANHFTSSGIVASDCDMPDSPENNFATFSSIDPSATSTLSQGNLQASATTSSTAVVNWQGDIVNGKYFVEFYISDVGSNWTYIGVASPTALYVYRSSDGNWYNNSSYVAYGSSYTTGDIIGLAVDVSNGTLEWFKNGVSQGSQTSLSLTDSYIYIAPTTSADTGTVIANFGQDSTFAGATTAGGNTDANGIGDFKYSVPTGALALCTFNLPEPTISPNADNGTADDYFNTATYSGNSSTQNITSVGFQPDWVWIKSRSNASNHYLTDVVRGTSKGLQTNISNAEVTNTNVITSFNSDGFSLGDDATANVANITGRTYVSWNWKAGGTAVSNTDGTITSSVSANTDAGFSIVAYQGNDASSATVGHGLSQAPEMVIVKNRQEAISNPAWAIYHSSLGATKYIDLQTTSAVGTATSVWNDTAPTSTVVTIGTADSVNSGSNHIMYCFHSVEGYSKFGSYTGNSSTDGTFVYTGFRPAFILWKKTTDADDWGIHDNTRDTSNVVENVLRPNLSNDEFGGASCDFLSNGFKWRVNSGLRNTTGQTYIYMAFAEAPFKYANAR